MLQKAALRKGFPAKEERQAALNERINTKRYLKFVGTIGGFTTFVWGYEGLLGAHVLREQTGACAIACGAVATLATVIGNRKAVQVAFRDRAAMNSLEHHEALESLGELLPKLEPLYEQPTQGPVSLEKV